jgi:hypothetical protein
MHKTVVSRLLGVMMTLAAVNAAAQVAGSMTIGVPATELTTLTQTPHTERHFTEGDAVRDGVGRFGTARAAACTGLRGQRGRR